LTHPLLLPLLLIAGVRQRKQMAVPALPVSPGLRDHILYHHRRRHKAVSSYRRVASLFIHALTRYQRILLRL
jgi:hypothetical protein